MNQKTQLASLDSLHSDHDTLVRMFPQPDVSTLNIPHGHGEHSASQLPNESELRQQDRASWTAAASSDRLSSHLKQKDPSIAAVHDNHRNRTRTPKSQTDSSPTKPQLLDPSVQRQRQDSQPLNTASPAATSTFYAYSDGAASSDTEASAPNSHTSDTDGSIGPFTPLTPSNPSPSSSLARTGRQPRSAVTAARSRRTQTSQESPADMTASSSSMRSTAATSSSQWRPRELRLVDRHRDASSEGDHIMNLARPARQQWHSPSDGADRVGLGIQLPKSPGIGLDLSPRSPAAGVNRPSGFTKSMKKGLKTFALANGGAASAPLTQSLSPGLREGTWDPLPNRSRTPTSGGLFPQWTRSPRSREASKDSTASDLRSAARSPLPILSPSAEAWSSPSGTTSWAREKERAATEAARLPTSLPNRSAPNIIAEAEDGGDELAPRSAPLEPTVEGPSRSSARFGRLRSCSPPPPASRTSRSLSPRVLKQQIDASSDAPPISPQQLSPTHLSFLSKHNQRSPRTGSSRKKAPPKPLVLLPNGRPMSRGSSFSGSNRSPLSGSSLPNSEGDGRSSAAASPLSPQRHLNAVSGGLLTPGPQTGSLLSPALSVYHEALSSPVRQPDDTPLFLRTQPDDHDRSKDSIHRREMDASRPKLKVSVSVKRASTPLKTARIEFDDDKQSLDGNESESDYGSEPSFGGSAVDESRSPADVPPDFDSFLYGGAGIAGSRQNSEDGEASHFAAGVPRTAQPIKDVDGINVRDRQSTPARDQQGTLSASSSLKSDLNLSTIPSQSSSLSNMVEPTEDEEDPGRTSMQSFSSDRLALNGHGERSSFKSESAYREAFEFDEATDADARYSHLHSVGSPEQPNVHANDLPAAIDKEDSANKWNTTPVAASLDSRDSLALSSASHDSALFSSMTFASPPVRAGPMGDLVEGAIPQSTQSTADIVSERVPSDLRVDGKTRKRESLIAVAPAEEIRFTEERHVANDDLGEDVHQSNDTPTGYIAELPNISETMKLDDTDATGGQASSASNEEPAVASSADTTQNVIIFTSPQSTNTTLPEPATEEKPKPHNDVKAAKTPKFDTSIFKSPAASRVPPAEEVLGPTDMPSYSPDLPLGSRDSTTRSMSPTADLYMRSLPERRSPTMERPAPAFRAPPPDAVSLASRPRLRLNTSSPPVEDAFKAPRPIGAETDRNEVKNAFSQPPVASSPIRPMHFPETRSAPLLQGAFPSPQLLRSPFAQQGAFPSFDYSQLRGTADENFGMSSRWSSGSESEDEAPKRNSKSRRSASSKKRSSSVAPSARNSVSSQGAATISTAANGPSATSSVQRKSLFQSLGLRKKSLPSLSSAPMAGSGRDSKGSSASGTPNPALPRSSQAYTEYPFPGMVAPSPNEAAQTSAPASHKPSRASGISLVQGRSSLASPSLAQPSLKQKQSSSSLRTNGSGGKSATLSEAASSPPPSPIREKAIPNFPTPSPRVRSRASSRASAIQALMPKRHSRGESLNMVLDRDSKRASEVSADAARGRSSLSLPRAEGKHTSRSATRASARGSGTHTPKSSQHPPASLPTIASMSFHQSQSSLDMSEAPVSEPVQAELQSPPSESAQLARSETPTSTEATPRVAYMALPSFGHSKSQTEATRTPAAYRSSGTYGEAFTAIGHGLYSSMFSPESEKEDPMLATSHRTSQGRHFWSDQENAHARLPRRTAKHLKWRRQKRRNGHLPHHPSLTDIGRAWIAEHPGQALNEALGPQLMQYSSSQSSYRTAHQSSSQNRSSTSGGHNDDDSSSDDYGASENNGNAHSGAGGGGRGQDSEGGSSDDDDVFPAGEDSDDVTSSEESEDDYGDEEEDVTRRPGDVSEDSDDVPLGQQYSSIDRVQSRLQAEEKRRPSRRTKEADSSRHGRGQKQSERSQRRPRLDANVSVANGEDNFNAGELAARLKRVQVRKELRHEGAAHSSAGDDVAASDATAVKRSPQLGRAPSSAAEQKIASLARARSLANRHRQKGTQDTESSGSGHGPSQGRARRGSDAAPRRNPSVNHPPISAMPSAGHTWANSALLASMPSSANPAVAKAAIAVASQAARDGRIPTAAIPLQAQALALQVTQATASPGIVSPVPTSGHRSQLSPMQYASTSNGESTSDSAGDSLSHSGLSRNPSVATNRRRPLGVDTRVAAPMSSALPSKSSSARSPPLPRPSGEGRAMLLSEGSESDPSAENGGRRSLNSRQHGSASSPLGDQMQHHKVYIVNKQRFAQTEVPINAKARDLVLDTLNREVVQMTPGRGAWVVFEVSPSLGIERPLREYEMVTQVINALPDPQHDYLLLKQTELAPYLSLRAVPSASPTLAGYVYVQDGRGKWTKRWLELRDHGLYHAKSEKGKDETFVCHISSFDVYLADSGAIKAPKAHAFCLRSQDKISTFENKDEYSHYFALSDPSAHRDWIRAIINARTYMLRQEHPALFYLPPVPTNQSPSVSRPNAVVTGLAGMDDGSHARVGASLSRSGTTKRPGMESVGKVASPDMAGLIPQEAVINTSPLVPSDALARGPFEKGSLLAKEMQRDYSSASGGHQSQQQHHANAPQDFSTHERTRARMEQERIRADLAEKQRRLKEEGKPLVSLGDLLRRHDQP
ncbi:unnamed protein product [Sympodiomycopsis kandeliae]